MQIAVVGAGIVGVATAYELAADGHQVTVFDRRGTVAAESSFANAGFVAPSYAAPWAGPGMRGRVLKQFLARDGALNWPLGSALANWRWMARWWRACAAPAYARNRRALYELARFSQQRLHELRRTLGLEYEGAPGILALLRTEQEAVAARRSFEVLRDLGVQLKELSAAQCHAMEPDLNADEPLAGAFHLAADETANCRQVAHLLREAAETRHGVDFRFAANITRIDTRGDRPRLRAEQLALSTGFASTPLPVTKNARTRETMARRAQAAARYLAPVNDLSFDAVVLCAGVDAGQLLRPLGLQVPLVPIHGYSVTFALRVKEIGPRCAVMDERYRIAIARMGPRVRVAGCAELGGDSKKMRKHALDTLYKVMRDWYPGTANLARPQLWKGARPMLPDGPPLIGASSVPRVWLNMGHGSSGWALACGSARLLADQIAQRAPSLDAAPFVATRYG